MPPWASHCLCRVETFQSGYFRVTTYYSVNKPNKLIGFPLVNFGAVNFGRLVPPFVTESSGGRADTVYVPPPGKGILSAQR